MNILLTSAGRRGYLVKYFKDVIGETGKVYVGNSSSLSPAFAYADCHVVTPLIYDANYIPFLKEYCLNNNITVIISLFDIDLYILACHKEEFKSMGIDIVVSDKEVIEVCNDKWKTYNFCRNNDFLVPQTFIDLNQAIKALNDGELKYPVIVKPRWGMGSIGVFQADNEEELCVFYKKTMTEVLKTYLKYESKQDMDNCVLIQEKLNGQEYGLDIINNLDNEYQNTVVRMKYAMRSGETDCALIVDEPELKNMGKRLSEKLKHTANLDTDIFIVDGKPYILEMNARFGGGYPFSHLAGVNLPKAILNWIDSKDECGLLEPKIGVLAQKDITLLDMSSFMEE